MRLAFTTILWRLAQNYWSVSWCAFISSADDKTRKRLRHFCDQNRRIRKKGKRRKCRNSSGDQDTRWWRIISDHYFNEHPKVGIYFGRAILSFQGKEISNSNIISAKRNHVFNTDIPSPKWPPSQKNWKRKYQNWDRPTSHDSKTILLSNSTKERKKTDLSLDIIELAAIFLISSTLYRDSILAKHPRPSQYLSAESNGKKIKNKK